MLDIIFSIGEKILILFFMIGVGVVLSRKKIITREGASQIAEVVLLIATPCIIVSAFTHDLSGVSWKDMLFVAVFAALIHLIGIALSPLLFRKEAESRQKVLRFCIIYGNVGFMGLPLLESFLGNDGVIYASIFITVFNIFCWTHGVRLMDQQNSGKIPLVKCLINPGTIGLVLGLAILLFQIPIPNAANEIIQAFSGLNTPLAMLCIGVHISAISPRSVLQDRSMLLVVAIRLLLIPAIIMALLSLFTRQYPLFAGILLQSAMPIAANSALFADRYHGDRPLASQAVALSTLLSILTLPLLAAVARLICG
ncbi:MAG: AEC family transporter [Candidatus Merdivicinus sp.]